MKLLTNEGEDSEDLLIFESEDFQHNKNYHGQEKAAIEVAESLKKALPTSEDETERK